MSEALYQINCIDFEKKLIRMIPIQLLKFYYVILKKKKQQKNHCVLVTTIWAFISMNLSVRLRKSLLFLDEVKFYCFLYSINYFRL